MIVKPSRRCFAPAGKVRGATEAPAEPLDEKDNAIMKRFLGTLIVVAWILTAVVAPCAAEERDDKLALLLFRDLGYGNCYFLLHNHRRTG